MVKRKRGRKAFYFVAKLYKGKELFMGYGWTEEAAVAKALQRASKVKGRKLTVEAFDQVGVGRYAGPIPSGLGEPPEEYLRVGGEKK